MLRVFLVILAALIASGVCQTRAQSQTPRINCNAPHQRDLDLNPVDRGPLRLARVYCQPFSVTASLLFGAPLVSPDAQSIAFYLDKDRLRVARLDGGKAFGEFPAALGVFARFGSNFRSVHAFAWRSDSKAIWTGNHEMVKPSGFALSPLRPVQAEGDGLTPMPPLQHEAGPLDGLLWIGGDGLALAHFGTRGGFRPGPADSPALAMVDVQRGLLLDTLPFAAVDSPKSRDRGLSPWVHVRDAAATLRDGKVRALVDIGFGEWLAWVQGEPPRVLVNPYAREMHNRMAISPDGNRVLIGRLLRTDGAICGRIGGCRPGKPVEGILAALHDLNTEAPIWSLRATVTNDYEFPTPAISPDGRYALVGLVPDTRALVALVSMRDGEIVQTIPAPGGPYAIGFAQDGRTVWTHAHGLTALYALQP